MKTGQLDTAPQCPRCSKILSGFTHGSGEETPTPGDVSVCIYCWEILEFTDSLELQIATADTIAKCDLVELQQANQVIRYLAKKTESPK